MSKQFSPYSAYSNTFILAHAVGQNIATQKQRK